jgi:molybdate transport system substrate-binding protein
MTQTFIKRDAQMLAMAALTALAFSLPAVADDIRVYSGGAPQIPLRAMTPEFEQATGHKVHFTFALVTVIQQKLANGEKADVILLPVPLIAATERTMPLRTEGRSALARVGIAVIIPEGATRPDISTADAVKTLLLNARKIAIPEPSTPSGGHLARIIEQLGLAEMLKPKLIVKAAIDGGGELVAKGEADVGFYLLSEVQSIKGIGVAGLMPGPLQSFVGYGSAIPASNTTPDAALAFIKYVSDASRKERWRDAGFELVAGNN